VIHGAAIVYGDGELVELDGAWCVQLLEREADLLRFARAFVESGEQRLAGLWQCDGQFYALRLEADVEQARPAAQLELTRTPLPYGLTVRELDVVTLVAGGLSNNEIGALLGSGGRTVGKHAERILAKLGHSSRAGVAAVAVEEGLLRLPLPASGRLLALPAGRVQAVMDGRGRAVVGRRRPPRRPYLIGSAFPLAGPVASDGGEMIDGSALAVAEMNARGGIGGRPVEQIVVDIDPVDPAGVRTALASLVEREVDAITSGWLYAERAAVDAVAPYGCPYLNAFTSEYVASLVQQGQSQYGSIFQVGPTEAGYGLGFVRSLDALVAAGAWKPPNRRLLFVEASVQSGHMATDRTLAAAERSGWQVEGIELIPSSVTRWDDVLDRIRAADPAAVMLTHWLPEEAAAFQRQFAEDPANCLVYVVYSPSVPAYVAKAGDAAEGVLWSTVTGSYGDAIGRGFAQRFQQRFGRRPGRSQAGIAYDEVHLLAGAWRRVGNPRRFREVADELARVPYRGVNGVYFLGGDAHCALSYPDTTRDPALGQAHLVLQVQGGESRVLAPEIYAEATFRTPSWMDAAAPAAG
jgi:branched-chain amino acid transport system substrate-binding protein